MAFDWLKLVLPGRPVPTRVWRGPFRGARIVLNPRTSVRKALGLYEHELNSWLEVALGRVNRVIDVGANDGYFTFGCAAAFRRLGKQGRIIGCEPQERHVAVLRESIVAQESEYRGVEIVKSLVGGEVREGMTTLDALPISERNNTLVKIDVEGAEMEVIEGGRSWLNSTNLFVIEVHQEEYLDRLREIFLEHGLEIVRVDQRPLPLLGRETRSAENWWLVSNLESAPMPARPR